MKALILAAGRGERLRPVTDRIPKMLLPVVSRRLLDLNIERLFSTGVSDIGINLFHHAQIIKNHLAKYDDRVHVVVEDTLKGTGGALVNFRNFFGEDFVVISGDVVSDIKLTDIIGYHRKHNPVATLVMTRHNGTKFRIGKDNRIDRIYNYDATPYTYAGVGVFSKRIFSFFPKQDVFSILDVFRNVIRSSQPLMGLPAVMYWYNINSPYTYWKIHHDVLNARAHMPDIECSSAVYIAPSSLVMTRQLHGFVSVGDDCNIAAAVHLENAVVLPGSIVRGGDYRNCLVSGSERVTV
ncbi:NDP-sugar synthase [candidate division WOR-3 bacterium]|nr:NDP-sugar synthase [candidate division WOR-3 bacterium]